MAQVTGAAEQSGDAAGEVLQAAGDLARRSESLQSEVGRFLGAIKAA